MIKYQNEFYFIDVQAIDEFLTLDNGDNKHQETTTTQTLDDKGNLINQTISVTDSDKPKEVHGVKYELIFSLLNDLRMIESGDGDMESISLQKSALSIKLAFNTLLYYKLIRKIKL